MTDENTPENPETAMTKKSVSRRRIPKDIVERVELYAPVCLSQTDLAGMLGVTRKTLYSWRKDDPRIDTVWDRARAHQAAPIIQKMIEDARSGDPQARRDFLKHQSSVAERFGKDDTNTTININAQPGANVALLATPRLPHVDAFLKRNRILDPAADDGLPEPIFETDRPLLKKD